MTNLFTAPAATLALALLALLAACGVRSTSSTVPMPTALEGDRTYAWAPNVPIEAQVAIPADNQGLAAELRKALDVELGKAGYTKVDAEDASLEAAVYAAYEKDVRSSDPQFTVYHTERIERGIVVMTLVDKASDAIAWQAKTDRVIRVTERAMGTDKPRWTGTEERRDWRPSEAAKELGKRLVKQ